MAQQVFLSPEQIGNFFKERLNDPMVIFVFSTDVVKNSWIDWCVLHPEQSDVCAVPVERFLAWDSFKGSAVRSQEAGKSSVPSLLRKFFVSSLISENAATPESAPLFKTLINPAFKKEADSFCDWLSKILPSLKQWHDRVSSIQQYKMDDEDKDFLMLFNRYSDFLNEHNFFEPSWVQPNFERDGKTYVIFYPELLEDYTDYIDIFAHCPEITLVHLPPEQASSQSKSIFCNKFSDSRTELRRVILQIRQLAAQKIRWENIALSVPDLETYRPYLERELTKYCVPFVIRAGFPLIKNTAGQIFSEIQKCFDSDFSYDSVRSLILDEYIPWKDSFNTLRENLIREGNRMRCICGYDEGKSQGNKENHFDSWEEALSATSETNTRELDFYRELKKDVGAICKASSFRSLQKAWIIFRDKYLSVAEFSKLSDAVLGQCITVLNSLIEIEATYCTEKAALSIRNHFAFFINELKAKTYTPQTMQTGIQVCKYKVAAGAYFSEHFVIDASQKNLEVQYRRLDFLNAEKRRLLGLEDDDKNCNVSKTFIRLYVPHAKDSANSPSPPPSQNIRFSYAEDSFSGFAICHNSLSVPMKWNDKKQKNEEITNPLSELDKTDFILSERSYMLGKNAENADSNALRLSLAQKNGFKNWLFFNAPETNADYTAAPSIHEQIKRILIQNRNKNQGEGKITITQSDMKQFFPCPRKWIFSNVIKLKEDSLDTDLMQPFDMGNINHKILELFMKDYEKSQAPLPITNTDGTFDSEENTGTNKTSEQDIFETVKKHAHMAITSSSEDFTQSPLTQKMLLSQEEKIALHIMDFLHEFLKPNMPPKNITKTSKTTGYGGYIVKGVELSLSAQNPASDYNYYGKLDLLLAPSSENPDAEGWTIIDYKNSKVPTQKDIFLNDEGVLSDFQMPMYITLLRQNKAVQTIDVARFYSIKEAKSPSCAIDQNTSGRSESDFEPTLETFTKYSERFAADVQEGALSPNAENVDVYTDCQKCNFKSVCRHNYEVAKRVMPLVKKS